MRLERLSLTDLDPDVKRTAGACRPACQTVSLARDRLLLGCASGTPNISLWGHHLGDEVDLDQQTTGS